jgi:hypothetical protein
MAAAVAVVLTSPSCGTDFRKDSGPSSALYLGQGSLPGVVGTLGTVGSSSTFLPSDGPTPDSGSGSAGVGNDSSPLGYGDGYGTQEGTADEELVKSGSRSTSALGTGEVFKLLWIAMVPEGVTPVPGGPHYNFKEGDSVDLYADYEVLAGTPFVRRWAIDSAQFDYTEPYVTAATTGEYRVKLNYVLPVGSATVNSEFSFQAYYGTSRAASSVKTTSVGVVIDGPGFQIIDITMVKDGQPVDWTLTHNQFYEGDDIDLWIKYEMLSNQMTLERHWDSPALGLAQWDAGIPTAKGVYEIKLDYKVPVGSAQTDAYFQYDLTGLGVTKYSDPFLFDILVPGAVPNIEPPVITNYLNGPSVWCGRMCIQTSHQTYPFSQGTIDGMVQNYDKRVDQVINYFDLGNKQVQNITDVIKDPNQKFKIIVANADLSFGARISINKTYNKYDFTSFIVGTTYDDTALSALPTYSLGGVAGSTKLTKLQVSFSSDDAHDRMLVASSPGNVRKNQPGSGGEYRNGAFTVQLVKVNSTGTDAFTTNKTISAGGVQGAASTGLLYELTTHYVWGGPGNKKSPWPNYNPGADKKCTSSDPLTGPRLLSLGTSFEQIGSLGTKKKNFPSDTAAYQMNWEDLLNSADADYNDFVGRIYATEYFLPSGNLKQVSLRIKGDARGNGDSDAWQLNMNGSFPGAVAVTTVNQFFDDGDADYTNDNLHNFDVLWTSNGGVALPVLSSTLDALPDGDKKSNTANTVSGTTFVEGDYSLVRIVFKGDGVPPGSYTPAPYTPELRVQPVKGTVYVYNLWQKKGDPLYSNGMPKGGFMLPVSTPWALEGKAMGSVYTGWTSWCTWLGKPAGTTAPAPNWWEQAPAANYYKRSLFQ